MGSLGAASVLLVVEFTAQFQCKGRTEEFGFQRRVLDGLDWRGDCHGSNQAAWRKHVSPHPPAPSSFHKVTPALSSFAQSVCIIGYTLFPLVIAALLSALHLPTIARIPVYIVLIAWSLAAGVSIMGGSGVVKNRVGIAVYPLFVFYCGLGCLCFIS